MPRSRKAVFQKFSSKEIVKFVTKTSKLMAELELLQAEFDLGIKKAHNLGANSWRRPVRTAYGNGRAGIS